MTARAAARFARPGLPAYLVRHYWWAYLWPAGTRLFDHSGVVNTILLGHYRTLAKNARARLPTRGRLLQLACVYGDLTPTLRDHRDGLHLADVAGIQLDHARRKGGAGPLRAIRANGEALAYRDESFDAVLLFFLLHELPPAARARVLDECLRVLAPGGRLVIADYGARADHHRLHGLHPLRPLLTRVEPFLDGFWREPLTRRLAALAERRDRRLAIEATERHFGGLYRVCSCRLF